MMRYTYPAFGNNAAVYSEPFCIPQNSQNQAHSIPGGFACFEFYRTWKQLSSLLKDTPLIVEILAEQMHQKGSFIQVSWSRQYVFTFQAAVCMVGLDNVLKGQTVSSTSVSPVITVRANSEWFPICAFSQQAPSADKFLTIDYVVFTSIRIGSLQLSLTLEDLGPSTSAPIITPQTGVQSIGATPDISRDSQEYAVALELEIWKHDQQRSHITMQQNFN